MRKYTNPIPDVEEKETAKSVKEEELTEDYTEYKLVYFVFIDILGFKKAFDDNRGKEDKEFAERYREVFNYFFELMGMARFMKDKDSYAGQTSDSLYFYTTRPDILLEFLFVFSHFNLYAMEKDVFFRGGVAKGNLFSKEKYQFYGESVIYAYLLENDIAKNPVVYVDENTYSELEKYDGAESLLQKRGERYYIKPFAGLDADVKNYVDQYFTGSIREVSLEHILENIRKNKSLFEYDAKNFEKYIFLINELDRTLHN